MPSKDRRRDVSSEAVPDWVDPPEAFDPLTSKARSAASAEPRSPAGPPASVDSEADRVPGPEAFGTAPAKATTPHPADGDDEAIDDVHSDRVDSTGAAEISERFAKAFLAELQSDQGSRPDGPAAFGTAPAKATTPHPADADDEAINDVHSDRVDSTAGSRAAEISERFAKAFLAEPQSDQGSRPDSAATTDRIEADKSSDKGDESFEAALRQVLRDAANRD